MGCLFLYSSIVFCVCLSCMPYSLFLWYYFGSLVDEVTRYSQGYEALDIARLQGAKTRLESKYLDCDVPKPCWPRAHAT